MSWGSCSAAHWKIFRYQLLLRFASFFQTFLKSDNLLKTEGVRKKDLTWDLQKKQLSVLSSSGFLTTAVGNGPNWKLVQQSTVGHNLLAEASLNQQWNLIWSGLSASLKDCQLRSAPVTGRLIQSCAPNDSYWWSSLAALVLLPLFETALFLGLTEKTWNFMDEHSSVLLRYQRAMVYQGELLCLLLCCSSCCPLWFSLTFAPSEVSD